MERESFVFYRSFYDCIKDLNDKQTRELVVAICERALDWNENEINDKIVKMAYNLIKPQLDANTKRYVDWCKGWSYWTMWWRPKSTWNNSDKPQWGKKNNPSGSKLKTPNVNDNDNVNVNDNVNDNVNGNEKEYEGKHKTNNMLDAEASRNHDIKKETVGTKDEVEMLKAKLIDNKVNNNVIEKIIEFDSVKKWTKIRKYKEPQLKAFLTTLNTWFTDEDKIAMLNSCIWNGYQWIYRNNRTKQVERPKVNWNMFH